MLYLFIAETVNSALDIVMVYEPLILNFGKYSTSSVCILLTYISRTRDIQGDDVLPNQ